MNKAYLTEKERRAERKAHKKRDKLKARKNRRVFALVWVCMVLLVSFTLASYLIKGSNDFFAVGRSQGTTSVTIPENVTLDDLTQILYEAGAIKEPEFFSLFCMVTVDDDEMEYFQPGTYNLDTDLDYQAIISTLQGATRPGRRCASPSPKAPPPWRPPPFWRRTVSAPRRISWRPSTPPTLTATRP